MKTGTIKVNSARVHRSVLCSFFPPHFFNRHSNDLKQRTSVCLVLQSDTRRRYLIKASCHGLITLFITPHHLTSNKLKDETPRPTLTRQPEPSSTLIYDNCVRDAGWLRLSRPPNLAIIMCDRESRRAHACERINKARLCVFMCPEHATWQHFMSSSTSVVTWRRVRCSKGD